MSLIDISFGETSHNQVLRSGWFNVENLTVKSLEMENLNVYLIDDDAFNSNAFWTLEYLKIFDVPLEMLKEKTFNGLKSLKYLYLYKLLLINIHSNVLAPMLNLETLEIYDCGENKINIDNLFGYTDMYNLENVYVHNCIFKEKITDKTFTGLSAISILLLESNAIKEIAPNSFDRVLKTVKRLSLGSNILTSIPKYLFETKRKVWINLQSNLWHCDCHMENLRKFHQSSTVVFVGLICNTPPKYNGEYLSGCPNLCEVGDNEQEGTRSVITNILQDSVINAVNERLSEIKELESVANETQEIGLLLENSHFESTSLIKSAENHKNPLPNSAFNQTETKPLHFNSEAKEIELLNTESTTGPTKVNTIVSISSTHESDTQIDDDIDEDSLVIIYILSGFFAFFIGILILSALIKLCLGKIRANKRNNRKNEEVGTFYLI